MVGRQGNEDRASRIRQVVDDCICRRVAGDVIPDDRVVNEHAELMPELHDALRQLAIVEQAERRFRDSSGANTGVADAPAPSTDSFPGYEIVGEIYRGGQGTVYQAVQHRTQRSVAIKVMKGDGPAASDRAARFQREIQILGRLNHPNILAIHDTGFTPDAFYYVADYISGDPLDEFVAARELSIREILDLYVKICDAVSAAHLLGVMHRDLKPRNVLVDQHGEPYVLDFGLAKMLTDDIVERTMTMTGEFVGSLPWASPEQIAGSPHDLDIRSDVYSLGVMLYQALTGSFPYAVSGAIREVIDNIVAAEPARPSGVRRHIDNEVETIVLKCLTKDRDRRYQTAGELARDIRHYLVGEPIDAKRDSVGYVLRKHLRRYRLPVATAAVLVLVVAVGFATSLAFWRDAVGERNAAEAARAESERQAAIAEAVNDFLNEDLLAAAKSYRSPNREVTVREVLDAAAETIKGRFEGEPLVEAAVRLTLGDTYRSLMEYELAELHLSQAYELRRWELGEDDPATLWAMQKLADLHDDQGRYEDAERLCTAALEGHRRVLGEQHGRTLHSLRALAVLRRQQGRYEEAERLGLQSLELRCNAYGEDDPRTALAMLDLANLHWLTGRYDQAEPLYLGALEAWGTEHRFDALSAKSGLAQLYRDSGRYDEAEPLLHEVLEARRQLYGDDHRMTLSTMNTLAELYRNLGRHDEAETLFVEALESQRRTLGEEHVTTLMSMNDLGHFYRNLGRYDEAQPLLVKTMETSRRVLGEDHLLSLTAATNLAVLYRRLGRVEEAESLYVQTLEAKRRALGEEHPHTLACLTSLGVLYNYMSRYDEAEPLLVEAVEKYRRVLGEEHWHTFVPMSTLAIVYHGQGRYDDAERLHREALEGFRRTRGESHERTLSTQSSLTVTLVALEKFEQAEPLARELLTKRRAAPQVSPATIAKSLYLLADILLHTDRPEETEPLLRECLEIRRASEAHDRLIASTESFLGGCLTALGRYQEAESLLLGSYPRIEVPGNEPDDDLARAACQRIIDLYEAWGDPVKADEWRAKLPSPP